MQPTTPQPVVTQSAAQPAVAQPGASLAAEGTLYTGMLKSNTNYTGTLNLQGNTLTFTDTSTGQAVLTYTPSNAPPLVLTFESLILKAPNVRYTFMPKGTGWVRPALAVGGVAGIGVAKMAGDNAGLNDWLQSLQAAGFNVRNDQKNAVKVGLIAGIVIVVLAVIFSVISVASK